MVIFYIKIKLIQIHIIYVLFKTNFLYSNPDYVTVNKPSGNINVETSIVLSACVWFKVSIYYDVNVAHFECDIQACKMYVSHFFVCTTSLSWYLWVLYTTKYAFDGINVNNLITGE